MGTLSITVDSDTLDKFDIALKLTGEAREKVIEACIRKYIAQSFSSIAVNYENDAIGEYSGHHDNANYGKALRRIPKWASKPNQINYKIVRAFLQLSHESQCVTYDSMLRRCSDKAQHPDVFAPTFATNFAQMKFDGDKSHGRVFDVDANGIVTIWPFVQEAVFTYQSDFLK